MYQSHECIGVTPVISAQKSNLQEATMAVRENQKGVALVDNVNHYEFVVTRERGPELGVDIREKLGQLENLGMEAMIDLFDRGCKWVFWISPKGGISNYPQSRFCLLRIGEIDNGIRLSGWGIKAPVHTGEECLTIAKAQMKLGCETPGLVFCFDDLRSTPLGFKKGDDEVFEVMRQTVDMPEVWDSIENGDVQRSQKEMEAVVGEELAKLPNEVRMAMSDYQFQYWLETRLAQRNIYLEAGGNHGGSVLGGMGVGGGVFNQIFGMTTIVGELDSRLVECKNCHKVYMKKKGECPACKS
ncbi:MAG: hypothetical protein WCT01_04060 [Candidatus Shapirobacteria bacterium]|jgi:hypothetical protein